MYTKGKAKISCLILFCFVLLRQGLARHLLEHAVQVGLKLVDPCLCLPSARIRGVYHHIQNGDLLYCHKA